MSEIFSSKLNSTNVPLAGGATFTGAAEIMTNWQELDINIAGSPASAPGTFYFEFGPDGINWDVSTPINLTGPSLIPVTLRVINLWFRVRYVNGSTPQTALRLTTVFHRGASMRLTRFLSQSIDPNEPLEMVRVAGSVLPDGAAMDATLASVLSAVTGTLHVTGSVAASAPFSAPLWVTGSVALNPTPVITANTATTGTTGLAVGNAPYQPLFITVTSSLPVTLGGLAPLSVFNAGTVGVSGSVSVSGVTAISASVPLSVFNVGTVGVSGSVSVSNFPATQPVSIASPISVFNAATVGVSGSVSVSGVTTVSASVPLSVFNVGSVGVTGSVSVSNFPATQPVSVASPLSVFNAGTVGVSGSVSVTGVTTISSSVPLSVFSLGTQAVSGSVSVTGVTTVSASVPLSVFNVGTVGVSGSVIATGTVQTWSAGTQSVSGTVGVNNFPATQNVSGSVNVSVTGSTGLMVAAPVTAPLFVTASAGTQFQITVTSSLPVSFPAGVNVTSTGSLAVGAPPYNPLWVTGSVALNPTPVITANTATTGSAGLAVGNAPYAPLFVTGSVALNPTPVITANTATTGSTGLAVGNAPYQPLFISVTSSLPVTFANLPPLSVFNVQPVGVTGTVNVGGPVGVSGSVAITGVTTVSASVPLSVFNLGAVGVSGSVSVSNFPATQPVSVASPLSVFNAGTVGVSGTVGVNNFPAVQAVTGSQLTGSTFIGSPVVIGGVFYTSGVLNSGSYIKGLQTDISGALYVTTSGTLPVAIVGSVPVTIVSQIQVSNFPIIQAISGTVNVGGPVGVTGSVQAWNQGTVGVSGSVAVTGVTTVSASVPLSVFNLGTVGVSGSVSVSNFPATQPVTFAGQVSVFNQTNVGVTGSVQAWNQGTVGVSGTLTTNPTVTGSTGLMVAAPVVAPLFITASANTQFQVTQTGSFIVAGTVKSYDTGTQSVTGSQLTGSTFIGSPVVVGGVFYTSGVLNSGSYVKGMQTDISGAVYVTTSGSLPVAVVGTVPVSIAGTINVSQQGQVQVSNFPATQNVSGTVTIGTGAPPLSVFNAAPVGVTGSVNVYTSGLQGISGSVTVSGVTTVSASVPLSVFSLGTQAVSGTVTANVTTTGSTGLNVGNASYAPLFVSITSSLPVTFGGLPPLSVFNASPVGVTGSISVYTQGAQLVSGTVSVSGVTTVSASVPLSVFNLGPVGVTGSVTAIGTQLTGSTFTGLPVVVAGVFYTSGVLNSGSYVKTLQTDISGAVYITTSGTLSVGNPPYAPLFISSTGSLAVAPGDGAVFSITATGSIAVATTGSAGLLVSFGNTPPAISTSTTGTLGLNVGNAPYQPLWITITSSLPVTLGGLPLSVFNAAPVGVTGSVNVYTQGAQLVSGTVTVAGVTTVSASVPLSVFNLSTVGVSGTVTANVTVTGSTGLMVAAPVTAPLFVTASAGTQFQITVTSSLPVTFSGLPPLSVYNVQPVGVTGTVNVGGPVGVSGSVAITGVTTVSASVPISVFNLGTVGVSGTITSNPTVTGSTGLMVAAPVVAPLFITASATTQFQITQTGSFIVAGTVKTYDTGTQAVSGAISFTQPQPVFNTSTVGVTGSQLTGSTFFGLPVVIAGVFYTSGVLNSGSYVKSLQTDISGAAYITTSGSLSVGNAPYAPLFVSSTGSLAVAPGDGAVFTVTATGSIAVATTGSTGLLVSFGNTPPAISTSTTGTLGLNVGNAPYQPLWITVTSSLPVTFGGLAPLSVFNAAPVGVTGSVNVYTSGLQGISGSVTVSGVTNVSASVPLSVFNLGTVGVSGSVTVAGTTTVSASVPLSVFNLSNVGVTGSVMAWSAGTQSVSGTVGVNNFPATQNVSGTIVVVGSVQLPVENHAVSGSQLTGSTFSGFPIVVGGVFYTSGILGSGSYIKSIETDISGAVYITASGSIAVTTTGSAGLLVSFGNTPPAISTSTTGTLGLAVGNAPYAPLFISVTSSLPVTFGGLAPLSVFNAAPVGVTGSVNVYTTGLQGVSGTLTVNPTVTGSTGLMVAADAQHPLFITATGSIAVATTGSTGLLVSFGNTPPTINSATSTTGTLGLNVGNAPYQPLWISVTSSLPVTFAGLPPLNVFSAAPMGVTGTVQVYTSGLQGVSGSVSLGSWTTNVTASINNPDTSVFGVISAASASPISASAASFVAIPTNGRGVVGFQLDGAWTGAIQFEGTIDGHNWWGILMSPPITGSAASSTTANGPWFGSVSGLTQFRARASALSVGVATVQIESNAGAPDEIFVMNTAQVPQWITATGSLAVATTGSSGLNVAFGANAWNLSGSVPVFPGTGASFPVTSTGSFGLQVGNSAVTPLWITATGSLSVTTSGSLPLDIAPADNAVFAVTTTGSVGLNVTNALKGAQPTQALQVQNYMDSGRTSQFFVTSSMSGVLGEALFNMQRLSAFILSGVITSSWYATNGKTLRLQTANLMLMTSMPTSASCIIRLRVSNAAPGTGASVITAKSPSIWSMGLTAGQAGPTGGGVVSASSMVTVIFPDGFEVSGQQQFGFTTQCTTTNCTIDFSVSGFEY